MRRSGPWYAGLLLLALTVVPAVRAAQRPPANLHWTGDHWSAWTPPSSFPEGAQVRVVERGDTLWDLAEKLFGDPYLWPQLWERNRYIEDSHWIYPGDPLLVDVTVTPIEQIAELGPETAAGAPEEAGATGETGELRLDRRLQAPEPLGSEADLLCAGFIGAPELDFERRVIGSEYENLTPRLSSHRVAVKGTWGTVDTVKLGLSNGDIIYLDGGADAGVAPGETFTVVTPKELVRHPVTGRSMGRFYKFSGRVRVLSVQQATAIGEIVHGCDPIMIGATLMPAEDEPVPLARRPQLRGVNDPSTADLEEAPVIVRSMSNIVSLGQSHVVFIDRGSEHDVVPGDIFTIYRLNDPGLPPVVVGELGVLSVGESTATARILESRYSVHVGDRLELEVR